MHCFVLDLAEASQRLLQLVNHFSDKFANAEWIAYFLLLNITDARFEGEQYNVGDDHF